MCQAKRRRQDSGGARDAGRLDALEATVGGIVNGQIEAYEPWPDGYATPNRGSCTTTLNWCQEQPYREHR